MLEHLRANPCTEHQQAEYSEHSSDRHTALNDLHVIHCLLRRLLLVAAGSAVRVRHGDVEHRVHWVGGHLLAGGAWIPF
jgi:hypothetical protein